MINNTSATKRYNDGDYFNKNIDWHAEDSPWKAQLIDKIICRNNLNLNSICEIGCGAGEILKQLSIKPAYSQVKFSGYEVSEAAFNLCKNKESEKLKFYYEDLLLKELKFDAILCIDVFEHVENYMGFLQKLRVKAKYKIFIIPLDLSVLALLREHMLSLRNTVGHLHYFTPGTAVATLEDCGYKILDKVFIPNFIDLPSKSFKAKIAKIPRLILYYISPKLLSKWLGGASLLVLAK